MELLIALIVGAIVWAIILGCCAYCCSYILCVPGEPERSYVIHDVKKRTKILVPIMCIMGGALGAGIAYTTYINWNLLAEAATLTNLI